MWTYPVETSSAGKGCSYLGPPRTNILRTTPTDMLYTSYYAPGKKDMQQSPAL